MRSTIVLALAAGCSIADFVYPPGPPLIERFEVSPLEIQAGGSTTLEWKVSGADSIVLMGAGDPRDLPAEGTLALTLDRTTTFELVATGPGGTTRALTQARIVELGEVRIARFEVTPSLVEPGDPVRIVWRTEHASRVVVRISSGETLIDHAPEAGTLIFRPERDVSVQLIAEGWPEPKTAVRTVRADPDGPIILFFAVQPTIVPIGEDIGLEWQVASADRVRLLELVGTSSIVLYDEQPALGMGFLALRPEAGTRTYLLEASNAFGEVVEPTTAFILPQTPPEIVDFTVTPTITGPGGDAVVHYDTRFTANVLIRVNGIPFFVGGPSGTYVHRQVPHEIITFELVAESSLGGFEERDVRTLVVTDALPAMDPLEVEPQVVGFGDAAFVDPGATVFVRWTARNANTITIANDVGQILHTDSALSGEFGFAPTTDVGLVVTAANDRGVTSKHLPLRVLGAPRIIELSSNTSVVRRGRPVTFSWSTELGQEARFAFETNVLVPLEGSVRQFGRFLGISEAVLTVTNDRATTSTAINISVIEPAADSLEIEPNDTEPFAGGPYFTFPGSIRGEVAGFDVDMYELVPPLGDRITLDTTPPGGCADGVALEVYEWNRDIGLLGPRLVVDGPSLCASANPFTTPALAAIEPPFWVVIRRPTGTSTIATSQYQLSFSAHTGACSDGVVDLLEDCDDANLDANDGCSPSCRLEGLDEVEPNETSPTPIGIETPARAYLSHQDIDRFRFEIDANEAGPRTILLESPVAGSCELDASLTLFDANGVVLATDDNGGLGCPQLEGPALILTQGVYTLEVRAGRGVTLPRKGRYVFSVR